MKKHLLFILAALLPMLASAQTKVEIDGIWYNLMSEGKQAEVTYKGDNPYSDNDYSGSITIPATVTYDDVAYSVTSIGDEAFRGCYSLTAIILPEGVTSIGGGAFYECSSLTAINIPEGVTSIVISAFYGCSSLTAINIPEGVTSIGNDAFVDCSSLTAITLPESVTSIGNYTFYGCRSLTAINIPEGVTSIGEWAFSYCSSLTAITLPEGVTSIGDYAFRDCSSLTAITIPASVTSIGKYAFCDCSSLTAVHISDIAAWCNIKFSDYYSNPLYYAHNLYLNGELVTQLTIPEGVTSIGYGAFLGCSSLTAITLPASVTSIGSSAFAHCSSLTSITIPEGVTSIGYFAFRGCSSLTSITIPEGVTSIGSYAFAWCSSLTAITLPEGVTSIGDHAFYNCRSLTAITCHAVTPPTVVNSYTFYGVDKSIPVYVPEGSVEDYKAAEYWKDFTNITALTPTYVSIAINQYGSGTYCSEYALDFSNVEGLKAYAAAGYDTKTGVVTLLRVMTAKAGVGLFIKGEPGEYRVPVIENTSYNSLNMLVGTLAKTAVNATSGDGLYANYKYTIKEGNSQPLFYRFTDGSTLGAGKAYLQIPMAWLPQTSEARSISLRFEEGEGTTDMDALTLNPQPSTEVYDLYGRRVDNPVKGGIYIVNGKKVVVK